MRKAPIMYHDGDQWRHWHCYNKEENKVAILVGGGPSLSKIDINKLKGPGKTVFGLNTTYPHVIPDIWIGMDDPKCYDRRVFHEAFPKIVRGNYFNRECEGIPLKKLSNVYFASVTEFEHKADIFYRISSDTTSFIWDRNVFITALNLILYMGFKKIYLAGVDFSLEEGDYSYSNPLTDKQKKWNNSLYARLYDYTEWLSSTCTYCGIDIQSISPNSPINEILPYIPLENLNKLLDIPEAGRLYHSSELREDGSVIENNLVSDEYKKLLQHEHSNSEWGVMAGQMIDKLETFLLENSAAEVLDYGAGSSSFKKALTLKNINVYEYDPGVPELDIVPDPKDYTICIDVLEHIEPELIDSVIKDLARVTKKKGFFTIAMYPAKRILKDGRNAHLILEDASWWISKLCNYFNITNLKEINKQLEVEVSPKHLVKNKS
jgi:hypothetical protein